MTGGRADAPPRPLTVAFATLGCKLNQVDTLELETLLAARGFRTVPFESTAQVYVINTCTVTARADVSDRQAIRQATLRSPGAVVVVTGCYAQTNPGAAAGIPGVDLVLGTRDKYALPDLLDDLTKRGHPTVSVGDVFLPAALPVIPLRGPMAGQTRPFVKVQDGCQHRCSFCIVPFARGGSRSQPIEVVADQVRVLCEAGYPEVVLTGVDLGHYGWDLGPRQSLAGLIRRLTAVPGLGRLRLSSILPAYVTEELIEVLAGEPRVCRHLHVPLQSGADRVLRLMRRPYHVGLYRALIERLARRMPGLGLGTDVITGFPGETEAEFRATEELLEELPFTYLHVFSYSDRRGTEAAGSQAPRVPSPEVRRRTTRLRRLGVAKQRAFRERHLGQTVEALVLERRDRPSGRLVGLTGDYLEVVLDGADELARRLVAVELTASAGERLEGRVVRAPGAARPPAGGAGASDG